MLLKKNTGFKRRINSVAVSRDGNTIYYADSGRSKNIKVWDLKTGKFSQTFPEKLIAHYGAKYPALANSLIIAGNGKYLLSAHGSFQDARSMIRVFFLPGRRELSLLMGGWNGEKYKQIFPTVSPLVDFSSYIQK